ncbi:heavy-metal-associated domain-containing protein [Myxococcota bacterium]|nr:heavy-metal-associated domain-containing protein [Myxococcota bacterium]MBU1534202.1 heavy-metal-associated domain-containing protein [Myxococcota bacterium]
MVQATLKFSETFCSSCVYAIERTGRKIKGIDEVLINASTGIITVDYSGDPEVLKKFRELTFTLGHGAEIIGDGRE